MEFSVETSDLAQVLRLVQAVTERKTTIPILGSILLTADSKGRPSPVPTLNSERSAAVQLRLGKPGCLLFQHGV